MKKINAKGFILAETLIVSVFLMVMFTMIYTNFYPLIGEYEKRENYDDVDGKYTAYWIKKIIESNDTLKLLKSVCDKKGALLITLLRMSPLFPFGVINYAVADN